jgi:hypothetical protein
MFITDLEMWLDISPKKERPFGIDLRCGEYLKTQPIWGRYNMADTRGNSRDRTLPVMQKQFL